MAKNKKHKTQTGGLQEKKEVVVETEVVTDELAEENPFQQKKQQSKKHKTQTGGLQEKKVKVIPTKEEIKQEEKAKTAKLKEKKKEANKDRPNFFVRMFTRIKEVFGELRRVEWPTLARTLAQTGVVLGVVVLFAIIIFGIDAGLQELHKLIVPPPAG